MIEIEITLEVKRVVRRSARGEGRNISLRECYVEIPWLYTVVKPEDLEVT